MRKFYVGALALAGAAIYAGVVLVGRTLEAFEIDNDEWQDDINNELRRDNLFDEEQW